MLTYFLLISLVLGRVLADVKFGELKDSYSATGNIEISWKDDGKEPTVKTLTSIKFLLCTGPNDEIHCFDTPLAQGISPSLKSTKVDLSVVRQLGASGMYYIQMAAESSEKGILLHYSPRFKLKDMTGSYKPTTGGDSKPPEAEDQAANSAAAGSAITYTKQTGRTKIAPMQSQPGTSVNLKRKRSRLYPSSAVTYFKTPGKNPAAVTTLTPSWSYTFLKLTNYAKPRPRPTKYYAASEALVRSYKTLNPMTLTNDN